MSQTQPPDPSARRGEHAETGVRTGGITRADAAALDVQNITKCYPGTLALSGVDLFVRPGTVHGLVGGNGSGKSTLVKVICGVEQGEAGGTISLGGRVVDARETSPALSHELGVRVVHQDLGVFPSMTVAENLSIGRGFETTQWGQVRWREVNRRAHDLIDRFDIPASPRTLLGELSRGAQTLVAIARALQDDTTGGGSLLILDEPTVSLPKHEADALLASVRALAADGQAILYISHRLDEITSTTDEVTVLRDGRVVASLRNTEVTTSKLVELIAGRKIARSEARGQSLPRGHRKEVPVLEVRELSVGPVTSATFDLRAGEVLGIVGLLGSGRSELLHAIFGDYTPRGGSVRVNGRVLLPGRPQVAMDAGLALVPEDRVHSGLFVQQSVAENLRSARIRQYTRGGYYHGRRARADAAQSSGRFGIKVADVGDSISTLSGGNQQKVLLTRWLLRDPQVLLLDEPTQGVDVGARSDIYAEIDACVAMGTSVLVVSSDLKELEQICHRVLVLRDGELCAQLSGPEISVSAMTELSHSGEPLSSPEPIEQEPSR